MAEALTAYYGGIVIFMSIFIGIRFTLHHLENLDF